MGNVNNPTTAGTPNDDFPLCGTWALVATRAHLQDGEQIEAPYGSHPMGIATFDRAGRMLCVLCDGRPTPLEEPREFVSYAGAYRFDGGTLITSVDQSSDPKRIGGDEVRGVTFTDRHRMTLTPPLRTRRGRLAQFELDWVRLGGPISSA
jgi:hypothetical protein